jgi:hypothetical protein
MFEVKKYPHGTFSWADCATTDAAAAKKFYSELMGWTGVDTPIGEGQVYTIMQQDGHAVAGVGPLPQAGMPPMWNNYVTVDDVDAMVSKVKDAGGKVIAEPFDVFDNGRMMGIQDPSGAMLSLWQAKSHIGAELVNTPGAMTWNELMTTDPKAAMDFFGQLFGWTYDPMDMGEMVYNVIMNNGRPNGGIMQQPPDMAGAPPFWMVYFSVADIDAAAEKVKSLGGSIMGDKIVDAGDIGRMAPSTDPQGASFMLMQSKNPQPWTE